MNLICKSLSHSFLLQFIEKAEAREKERLKKEEREVRGGITFVLRLSSSYEYIPGLCSSSTPLGRQENLSFSYKSYAGHPGFHRLRALDFFDLRP